MIRFRSAAVLALLLLAAAALPAQNRPRRKMSLDEGLGGVRFSAGLRGALRWADDGMHLNQGRRKLLDPGTWKEVDPPAPRDEPAGPDLEAELRDGLSKLKDGARIPRIRAHRVSSTLPRAAGANPGLLRSEDGNIGVAYLFDDIWAWNHSAQRLAKVTGSATSKRRIELAPDGRAVSFLEDNNLCIAHTDGSKFLQISEDASEDLFYGELDWVYQEEVYGRFNFKGTWWSPASTHLAFMRIDESAVDTFVVVDHLPQTLEVEELKYPKAGQGNPVATLWVAQARDGAKVPVDLSKYAGQEILINRVGWRPDGSEVLLMVQDREQTWLDLDVADPGTGKLRTLFRETSRAWVNVLAMPRWLQDGSFLWESERSGYKHLYHYDAQGKLLGAVTRGEWQVRDILRLDEKRGFMIFTATKDGAVNDNAYIVDLDGKNLRRLTRDPGMHRISLNGDATLFLDNLSSLDKPGEQRLVRVSDGEILKIIATATPPRACEIYGYSTPELVSIPARDGYPLDATIIKPHGFEAATAYPVWIETYSGPDAPSVRNRWNGSPWAQFLAQRGYIFFQVNVRTASGRGQCHTDLCYEQFGVQELKDLEDAVDWLCAKPWADAERVGITGWSYGGYMAAYALCRSDKFKLGIAGAGVYDWRLYDTIYTERYMRTPQNNPEGYELSSCMPAARNLHGHLLIIHGTMDDNVHVQNALQLSYALQRARKSFELMLYPKSRHGVRDPNLNRHMRELMWTTIQEQL